MAATHMQAFLHVDYLWDREHATALGEDQVALFLYRSNLLGADLRITNYGGATRAAGRWKRIH